MIFAYRVGLRTFTPYEEEKMRRIFAGTVLAATALFAVMVGTSGWPYWLSLAIALVIGTLIALLPNKKTPPKKRQEVEAESTQTKEEQKAVDTVDTHTTHVS